MHDKRIFFQPAIFDTMFFNWLFGREAKREQTGGLIVCSKRCDDYLRDIVSRQLTDAQISHISVGKETNFYDMKGHGNIVVLVVDFGNNLRLQDESGDGGYKNEMSAARRLAQGGELWIIVCNSPKHYLHLSVYKHIDLAGHTLNKDDIVILTHALKGLKERQNNIQIDCNQVPLYLQPTILKSNGNFLLVWPWSQVTVKKTTPVTIEIALANCEPLDVNLFKNEYAGFAEQIEALCMESTNTVKIYLRSTTTLDVQELSLDNLKGVLVRARTE
jgi:hypothetical protein